MSAALAIGSEEGGHDAIHPELGSFEDFRGSLPPRGSRARRFALDFRHPGCAPDHPWIKEHPECRLAARRHHQMRRNPPKKYEEHRSNVSLLPRPRCPFQSGTSLRGTSSLFWVDKGITVFRCRQSPHQAVFRLLGVDDRTEVREKHPEVIFPCPEGPSPPAEVFMKRSGEVGFTQIYTYFTPGRNERSRNSSST